MSHTNPTNRQWELVSDWQAGLKERNRRMKRAVSDYRETIEQAEQEFQAALSAVEANFAQAREAIGQTHAEAVETAESLHAADEAVARSEHDNKTAAANRVYDAAAAKSEKTLDETRWMVTSVLDDESADSPKLRLDELTKKLQRGREHLKGGVEALAEEVTEVKTLLKQRRQRNDAAVPELEGVPEEPEAAYDFCAEAIATGRAQLPALKNDKIASLFIGWRPVVIFLIVAFGLFALTAGMLPTSLLGESVARISVQWLAVTAGVSSVVGVLLVVILYAIASSRCDRIYQTMLYELASAELALHSWRYWSDRELRRKQKKFEQWQQSRLQQRDQSVAAAEERHNQVLAEEKKTRDAAREIADREFAQKLQELEKRRDEEIQIADRQRDEALSDLTTQEQAGPAAMRATYENRLVEAEQHREQELQAAGEAFDQIWRTCRAAEAEMTQLAEAGSLSRAALESDAWEMPDKVPQAVPIGRFSVDAELITDTAATEPVSLSFPVLLPFTSGPSLLLEADGEGRNAAIDVLRMTMLRLLTSLPAGKVRFTIIDPVGLGEQFSSFMHLADYDELLVNSRIWTEGSHIEQRLADLTEHMENVFQTYLRNEYASIEEYNEFAGEVAEPYHFLVIANFPANFSEIAARRLVSIIGSGARCGVHTLISVDTARQLPYGLELLDLTEQGTRLIWRSGHFESSTADLSGTPLQLEMPPDPAIFSRIVRRAGELSQNARRVEVAFDRIAPAEADIWSLDSRRGIDVPLGRAGATKLQHLRLGRGTSQHVLVAGKTGSGKSTFLHALITNIALYYSPDEIELYLIDFKKGVEFKAYASGQLPHARVIAIESDREFGVSVLKRLDQVLSERGELFRERGVQDIEMFRNASPYETMPRILLLVDEFQEFFTEDDKLSQTATLLLDRLVRQGRAFGIHVLLGSQTLGGAYSLARSTLGQVAVRIALQCSESDAHLILSEENTAARLLTRPGEAIYNDANGLVDGNHPFQIAWLPDEQRSEKLKRILNLAMRRDYHIEPPIVFEGNLSADPTDNPEIRKLVEAYPPAASPAFGSVWLGDPVELRAASPVEFRRQSGANLLIAGGDAEAATGMLSTCLAALAYQYPPGEDETDSVGFHVLDASPNDQSDPQDWETTAARCGHRVHVGGTAEAEATVNELVAEIDRRLESPAASEPPLFLFVAHLSGFRNLRKDEDDFGSWNSDPNEPVSAGKQFSRILCEGPAVGVHVLIWCDSYNNVNRWLGNKLLRELEVRACFRMNANDSSQLIDTPAAGRLGTNRALLYHDSTGSVEKFRPYRAFTVPATTTSELPPNDAEDNSGQRWDDLEMFSVK